MLKTCSIILSLFVCSLRYAYGAAGIDVPGFNGDADTILSTYAEPIDKQYSDSVRLYDYMNWYHKAYSEDFLGMIAEAGEQRETMGDVGLALFQLKFRQDGIEREITDAIKNISNRYKTRHRCLVIDKDAVSMKYYPGKLPLYGNQGEFYLGYALINNELWIVKSKDFDAYLYFDTDNADDPKVIDFVDGGEPNDDSYGFSLRLLGNNHEAKPYSLESKPYYMSLFRLDIDECYKELAKSFLDDEATEDAYKNIRMVATKDGIIFEPCRGRYLRFTASVDGKKRLCVNWGYFTISDINFVVCTTDKDYHPFNLKNASTPKVFEFYQVFIEYQTESLTKIPLVR